MSCPDCIRIRHELDAAVERVRQLEQAAGGDGLAVVLSARLGLAPMPARLMAALVGRDIITRARALDLLYAADPNGGPDSDKIVDVMICKLRRRLRPHGIEIVTRWGFGWELKPDMKAKVRELIGGGA